ncbi:MAG: 30S ribosomal protein S16 [Candidatus Kaiserbacteria bacterium]|nr:30S ribosomal protein S16 [Candidatus Kaiserbacteria bacterium]
MLMIRFQRTGRTNDPAFRIVLLEKTRAAKAGSITEQLGTYNPKSKALTIDAERVKEWIAKGAQPTDSIRNLLITKGILEGKKVNVLPKKTPIKSEEPEIKSEIISDVKVAAEEVLAPVEEAVAEDVVGVVEDAAAEAESL